MNAEDGAVAAWRRHYDEHRPTMPNVARRGFMAGWSAAADHYEHAISWDVTCFNCARLMDQIYQLDQVDGPAREQQAAADALDDAAKAVAQGTGIGECAQGCHDSDARVLRSRAAALRADRAGEGEAGS